MPVLSFDGELLPSFPRPSFFEGLMHCVHLSVGHSCDLTVRPPSENKHQIIIKYTKLLSSASTPLQTCVFSFIWLIYLCRSISQVMSGKKCLFWGSQRIDASETAVSTAFASQSLSSSCIPHMLLDYPGSNKQTISVLAITCSRIHIYVSITSLRIMSMFRDQLPESEERSFGPKSLRVSPGAPTPCDTTTGFQLDITTRSLKEKLSEGACLKAAKKMIM